GKTVDQARAAADRWHERHQAARSSGDDAAARDAERQADAERARMHAALAEMAQLQSELERLEKAAAAMPPGASRAAPGPSSSRSSSSSSSRSSSGATAGRGSAARPSAPPRQNVDDVLEQMKRQQGKRAVDSQRTIDDELAALK